jgi:CheY-like chemotaxis protein
MDGIAATRMIREEERERGGHVVVIALSASALEHERGNIIAAGCDDFLPKPFREDAIFAKVAAHLGVEYVYDGDTAAVSVTSSELSAASLAALPEEWIAALRNAITLGDTREAARITDLITERDTWLAASLRKAIQEFRFDEIENALSPSGAP